MGTKRKDLSGCRILIVNGTFDGQEGVVLGKSSDGNKWAISPDGSSEILDLAFEKEFGLLLDMSGDAGKN